MSDSNSDSDPSYVWDDMEQTVVIGVEEPPENLERVIDLCRRQRYFDVADWLEQFDPSESSESED